MNKVKIGGIQYKIEYKKDLGRDRDRLGECNSNLGKINLDSSLPDNLEKKVLLHEIIEAINFDYELKLEHNKITILESTLYQVIIDNQELIKSFWDKENKSQWPELEKKLGVKKND